MKVLALIALMVAVAYARRDTISWESFKQQYGKTYMSAGEEAARRAIFINNVKLIKEHNKAYSMGEETFYLGVNEIADMTAAEVVEIRNGFGSIGASPFQKCAKTFEADNETAPVNAVDWRTKGYVTPIKNQGQCGSCWAFAAVASLEGQHFAKTKKLVSLSEQNLVDCSHPEGNDGCEGGLPDQGFNYVKKNGGIDTEASYPYTAEDGTCHYSANSVGAHDTGCTDVTSDSETALTQASAKIGPIAVGIDASSYKFQLYKGGVYYNRGCSSTQLDHGVTVVGYGTMSGVGKGSVKDYYIVKNSWGTSWGLKGYIYMARNKNNNCGIATAAGYPNVPANGLF